jgi:hypothetical protein
MQRTDSEPDDGGASGSPRASDSPPVGEGLVVSRRRPPTAEATAEPTVPTGPMAGRLGVVTGATGELGIAFAGALAGRGARVVLVDADLDALCRAAAALPGADPALVLRCDLGSADDVAAACSFLRRAGTNVDLVVHAAAASESFPVLSGPVESLDEQYLINVRAPSLLSQHLAGSMSEGARVVFVDRDPEPSEDGGPAQRSVLAAARRELVEVLRHELWGGDVSLLAASCASSSASVDVAEAVLDVAARGGPARVTAVRVEHGVEPTVADG